MPVKVLFDPQRSYDPQIATSYIVHWHQILILQDAIIYRTPAETSRLVGLSKYWILALSIHKWPLLD